MREVGCMPFLGDEDTNYWALGSESGGVPYIDPSASGSKGQLCSTIAL
jgi:hypothetical protein